MMFACFRHNILYMIKKKTQHVYWAIKRAERVKIPPAKPDDLISILRAHKVVRTPSHKLSSDFHKNAIGMPS